MPFVPVPSTALAEIRMSVDSQKVENTTWWRFAASPTEEDLTALGEALEDWWINHYGVEVFQGVQLREIACTDMSSATGPQVIRVPPFPLFGEVTGDALPTNCSLTVSLRTNARGRSFRGRNYIVGLMQAQTISPNRISTTVTGHWIEHYTALIAVGTAVSAELVIASRFSGVDSEGDPIPRTTGVTTPVTSVAVVDDVIDSQRRRLPGRGQ